MFYVERHELKNSLRAVFARPLEEHEHEELSSDSGSSGSLDYRAPRHLPKVVFEKQDTKKCEAEAPKVSDTEN